MKKKLIVLTSVFLIISLSGCKGESDYLNQENRPQPDVLESKENPQTLIKHTFISGEEAIEILAADDDYTSKLSIFDYRAKFQSNVALDQAGRSNVLKNHILEWNDTQIQVIDQAMTHINQLFSEFNIDMPDISFILTSDANEDGAAYTRGTSIILKPHFVQNHSVELEHLIVHEMFHVYSRTHKELRPDIYATIGYKECEELVWPNELSDLKISNPDAPDNNFYISGKYSNIEYDFMPIIYSSEPYEVGSGKSFFSSLLDKFIAVEIVDGIANPIYKDGKLLIVDKNSIVGFYEKIGYNTNYTYHPEETIADNFVFMIFNMDVESPFVLERLNQVLNGKN